MEWGGGWGKREEGGLSGRTGAHYRITTAVEQPPVRGPSHLRSTAVHAPLPFPLSFPLSLSLCRRHAADGELSPGSGVQQRPRRTPDSLPGVGESPGVAKERRRRGPARAQQQWQQMWRRLWWGYLGNGGRSRNGAAPQYYQFLFYFLMFCLPTKVQHEVQHRSQSQTPPITKKENARKLTGNLSAQQQQTTQ